MSEEEPPIQYYEIIDFKTISKRGRWWTLLALLRDTDKDQVFISLYKFQKRTNKQTEEKYWAKASSFRINNKKHIENYIEALKTVAEGWEEE